jgi:predicted O-methyltransferase YrrM
MSKFELVDTLFPDVGGMTTEQAHILRGLLEEEDARNVLEIGFVNGKSSAYISAVLHDMGEGQLTTLGMQSAYKQSPNIDTLLAKTGLAHLVSPFYCKRAYTWELQRLINSDDPPTFDFCFFSGGLTWDQVGFGVFLVNMLLRPGGVLTLVNMDWSMERSPYYKSRPEQTRRYDPDEIEATPVRLVWDTVLPALGFEHVREYEDVRWGIARKQL